MNNWKWGKRSLTRLTQCHPLLITLMNRALKHSMHDITILCGHRGKIAQDEALRKGTTRVAFPNSKHNKMPSHAVDIAPYPIDWNDHARFRDVAEVVKKCWSDMEDEGLTTGWKLTWGGDWRTLVDMPHFQIDPE